MGSITIQALHPDTYELLGIWDTFKFLQIRQELCKPGYYQLILDGGDKQFDNLVLDSVLSFIRTSTDGETPYDEWWGLHRTKVKAQFSTGLSQYSSFGRGLLDLLNRRIVACPAGIPVTGVLTDTGGYIDNMPISEAMWLLIDKHAGEHALASTGRAADGPTGRTHLGQMPTLAYANSPGTLPGAGPLFTGEFAWRNLLVALQEMSEASHVLDGTPIEFNMSYSNTIVGNQPGKFSFNIHDNGVGVDKSVNNTDGNTPVIFSTEMGNVQDVWASYTRSEEINRIFALGDGDGAARSFNIVSDPAKIPPLLGGTDDDDTSIFNLIEASRDAVGESTSAELTSFGATHLWKNTATPHATFIPIQFGPYLYGRDYFLGDKITVQHEEFSVDLRITAVELLYDSDGVETIKLEFSDRTGSISASYYSVNPDDPLMSVEGDIELIYNILQNNNIDHDKRISR